MTAPGPVVPRRRPPTRWLLGLVVALGMVALPAVLPVEGAVVVSFLGGLGLVGLAEAWWSRVALGPVQLEGSLLVARTARGTSTVDLSRLRYVGGQRTSSQGAEQDTLFLRDRSGRRVAITGEPGFRAHPRHDAGAMPLVYDTVRAAVVAGQVHDVSEAAKQVLGLPSRSDISETLYALALWGVLLAAVAVVGGGTVVFWYAVLDL